MDSLLDSRFGLLASDDGFDPVAEIKRLRRNLMLRLQRLQQSIASEADIAIEGPTATSDGRGTILYVSSDSKQPDLAPEADTVRIDSSPCEAESETSVAMVTQTPLPPVEPFFVEEIEEAVNIVPPTVVAQGESALAWTLGWINAALVSIGAVGAAVGICYFVFQKQQLTNPQGLAVTLLAVGAAMVLVGIIGRLSHQHAMSRLGSLGP